MKIVKHEYQHKAGWSARPQTTEIILHCSATVEGKDYSVEQIDRWHKERGFNAIGYNYVIYRDGSIHVGRPVWAVGAHCTNHNSKSIGICYIGGVAADGKTAKDTRTDEQKVALYELVEDLCGRYGLTQNDVYGHRQFANKACPSFLIQDFRREYLAWKIETVADKFGAWRGK